MTILMKIIEVTKIASHPLTPECLKASETLRNSEVTPEVTAPNNWCWVRP